MLRTASPRSRACQPSRANRSAGQSVMHPRCGTRVRGALFDSRSVARVAATHEFGARESGAEPVVAPNDGRAEDDPWILTVVHDPATGGSAL